MAYTLCYWATALKIEGHLLIIELIKGEKKQSWQWLPVSLGLTRLLLHRSTCSYSPPLSNKLMSASSPRSGVKLHLNRAKNMRNVMFVVSSF